MAPTRRTAFLTDDFVCALQPPTDTTQIIVWDAPDPGIPGSAGIFVPGLGIRVTAGGVRAFVLDYRIDGVQRRPKIGRAPPWTVDRARRRAIEWRTKIDNGIDVRGERRSKRARIAAERDREAKELTMRQLAERFERSYIPTKRPRTAEGYKSQLKVHVLPSKIADLPISQITVADISELHTEASTGALSGRPAPTQANRTVTMLHRMFELARVWGLTPPGFVNPARTALRGTNEGGVVRNEEHPRERYPTEEEMGAIKAALDRHPIQRNADAIRMLVLTGCRRNEILTATWSDIDFGKSIWNRPAIRQKGKKNHSVPLAPPAAQLLLAIRNRQIADGVFKPDGFVFASGTSKSGHLTNIRKTWVRVLRDAGVEGMVLHSLRHGFASTLISAGYDLPVVSRLMAHSSPSITQRYAHLRDDVAQEAVDKVADLFGAAEAPKPAPVAHIGGRRRR